MISYNDMMSAIAKMNPNIIKNGCSAINVEKLGVVFNEDLKMLREKLGYPKKLGD